MEENITAEVQAAAQKNYDPYWVLKDFFEFFSLNGAREELHRWLEAAFKAEHGWKQYSSPGNLLFFYDRLLLLIDAAYDLSSVKSEKQEEGTDSIVMPKPAGQGKIQLPKILPCLLQKEEWSNPYLVLTAFFEFYDLDNWNTSLHQLLHAGLANESFVNMTEPEMLLPVCMHLQKLLDATYLIFLLECDSQKEGEDDGENGDEESAEEKLNKRFSKMPRLMDGAIEEPYKCVANAFITFSLDDICDVLKQWLMIAMRNELSAYDKASDRTDLMDFCDALQELIEALQVINEKDKPPGSNDWKDRLPQDLREAAKKFDQPELLTEEQTENPMMVLKEFFEMFTMDYVRVELWDLLDSAISYEEEGKRYVAGHNLLLTHDCLLCLVQAAYSINNIENNASDNK